ncbi:hypothetical protein FB451DRAFT_681352 [Mycena latifolia]|nr:hypothetical protein FB451DRAFT_681352 [Mycena latifolia]
MASGGPRFPPELEREIFETTAVLYPETIRSPSLLLVAKRVHEWIERIKYTRVSSIESVTAACPSRLLQSAIRSNSKPIDFFRERVRHLFLDIGIRADDLQALLSACSGLRSIKLPNSSCTHPSILPNLAAIQPRRLAINLWDLFSGSGSLDLSHPAFARITHLESFDNPALFAGFPWSDFARLPALTHLALWQLDQAAAAALLSACPQLEVLIRSNYLGFVLEDRVSVDDARFVSMPMSYNTYQTSDWLAGTGSGVDFWVRAERFIAKKRRGKIEPRSRCWIDFSDRI